MPKYAHLPALDGLRALAVLLVVMHHWEIGAGFAIDRGLLGVRLFFVLSGFLISGILLNHNPTNTRDVLPFAKAFYLRRALRIVPVFYCTLAVLCAVDAPGVRAELAWHALYASNFLVAKYNQWVGLPSHFWSLAVEEQFYLLWPWVLLLTPRRWLPAVLALCIASSAAWRSIGVHFGLRKFALLYLLPGCIDSLAVGAVFALLHQHPRNDNRLQIIRWSSLALGLLTLAVASIVTAGVGATPLSHSVAGLKGTAYALVLGSIVSACAMPSGAAVRLLSVAPLTYLGRISYAVYVVHPLLWVALAHHWPTLTSRPARWLVASLATLALCELSRRVLENPINGLKRWFEYPTATSTAAPASDTDASARAAD